MKDRDSSFALETVFYHELLNNAGIKDLNFEFAWLYPHSGNYDAQEAFKLNLQEHKRLPVRGGLFILL